jgi:hypothetical protein
MAQTLSLPSSLNMTLNGWDLDAFTWFHVAGKRKDSYQAAGRKLQWNLHATIVQIICMASGVPSTPTT